MGHSLYLTGLDECFILPAMGWPELGFYISIGEVLVVVVIEIVVALTIVLLIVYYWNATRKAIKKPKLNQTLLTSTQCTGYQSRLCWTNDIFVLAFLKYRMCIQAHKIIISYPRKRHTHIHNINGYFRDFMQHFESYLNCNKIRGCIHVTQKIRNLVFPRCCNNLRLCDSSGLVCCIFSIK